MGQLTFPLHPQGGISWYAPPRPTVSSVELRLVSAESILDSMVTRWNQQLARPPAVAVHSVGLSERPPRVISVPISPPVVRVQSFEFAASGEASSDSPGGSAPGPCPHQGRRDDRCTAVSSAPPHGHTDEHALPATGSTRIKPPSDVIKLGDRLHYLLQPSLESLLAERSLAFPSHPFPFQLEGIAFLYPRHAAILADEMGLGKTMQAITGIRLLIRCAEIRRVLVVCPKALVTNWQREFALWAPELPLLVIEGNQTRRLWQWQLPDMPVRIVNYELLCRDRHEGGPWDSRSRIRGESWPVALLLRDRIAPPLRGFDGAHRSTPAGPKRN